MTRIVEISGQIDNGMWDYSALDLNGAVMPPTHIESIASIARNGFDAHELRLSPLTGTYVETAAHLIEGRPTIDQVPVQDFIRPAKIMRLPTANPRTLIRVDDLKRHDPGIEEGDALLIDTGWGTHWNQPDYISHAPAFAGSTLQWFLEQPFSFLGLDTPVMECRWAAEEGVADEAGPLLAPIYERGMLLLAPLAHLSEVQVLEGTLIAFPLNIVGVCSTPCRAIFVEGARWG